MYDLIVLISEDMRGTRNKILNNANKYLKVASEYI